MHYIRLLRPPTVVHAVTAHSRPGQGGFSLGFVLTITTDLGESFLCPDAPIDLTVELVVEEDVEMQVDKVDNEVDDDNNESADGSKKGSEELHPEKIVKTRIFKLPLAASSPASAGKAGKASKPSKATAAAVAAAAAAAAATSSASQWRAGMRVLKVEARLSKDAEACLWGSLASTSTTTISKRRVCICTVDKKLSATHARQLVEPKTTVNDHGDGLIMPLWVDVPERPHDAFPHVAVRQLLLQDNVAPEEGDASRSATWVEVEEEIGESIARHVWDAGLVAVAYLANTCLAPPTTSRKRPREEEEEEEEKKEADGGSQSFHAKPCSLPDALRSILVPKHKGQKGQKQIADETLGVLELGSGVGILGIGLAAIVQEASRRGSSSVAVSDRGNAMFLLTDLPEAEEHARANMARSGCPSLDYENLDWEEGRQGRFGPAVAGHNSRTGSDGSDGSDGKGWDLVVLSDCTYNVDMLPALVETLTALSSLKDAQHARAPPSVLLARKPRHASEEALFPLMADHGWTVRASSTVPLPVLDGEAQIVELYLYEKKAKGRT
ncbi:MAG: hypothetical protein STHCBS139747_004709 [Sporothrix thermara]